MANSRFEYVKLFEENDVALPNTFIVVRIDGRAFTKFCKDHAFVKPNDDRALALMNRCALQVAQKFPEICIAYGQSDEYSFAFRKDCETFNRRKSKLLSCIVSLFSSSYVFFWHKFFPEEIELKTIPEFDGRVVLYPSLENLRDYFKWRQADCHINNLYNTCFWTLVQKGNRTEQEAEQDLSGTFSKDKHELLFSKFNINYNNEREIFKKGSVILPHKVYAKSVMATKDQEQEEQLKKLKKKKGFGAYHIDIMQDSFWELFAASSQGIQ